IWADQVPHLQLDGGDVRIISGTWGDVAAPAAPAASWANDPVNEVALYILTVKPNASVQLPTASKGTNRMMYHIDGGTGEVEGHQLKPRYGMELDGVDSTR
ncbi:MAG: hypothetical protein VW982_07845, partial [Candidatus Poseidoniales archaeon]